MNTLFELEKKKTIKAIQKKLASFEKAIKQAKSVYESTQEFENVKHLAELVKADFSQAKSEVKKQALQADELRPERVQELFEKSERLQKAMEPIASLLKKFDSDIHHWLDALKMAEEAKDAESLKALQKSLNLVPSKEKKQALPYHLYHSHSGLEIYVGKTKAGNEKITFEIAHEHDLWLHAHAMRGAHVIVRKKKGHSVDPETLEDALQLALYYSKAKEKPGTHEVLVTEKEFVSQIPHTKNGEIVVAKHKTFTVSLDEGRVEKLLKRTKKTL